MTMMEFAGRLANHIAAHAIGKGCEIDSFSVMCDPTRTCIVRVARRELHGLRVVKKMYPAPIQAQMGEIRWLFDSEAERIVGLLLAGEGELT